MRLDLDGAASLACGDLSKTGIERSESSKSVRVFHAMPGLGNL